MALWAARDRAHEQWRAFTEEMYQPLLEALETPFEQRTEEQGRLVDEDWERRTALLTAVFEVERQIRVATGHETP
jgi:hypothetical protein